MELLEQDRWNDWGALNQGGFIVTKRRSTCQKIVLQTQFGHSPFQGTRPNCLDVPALNLELQTNAKLHLEHLASRIDVGKLDSSGSWITSLQEERVRWPACKPA